MTRLLDLILSLLAIIIFSPIFIFLALWIKLDSRGPVFYKQKRVGWHGKEFWLYKFRSMRQGADKDSLLTFSEEDTRITKSGKFIRKYKLDELPQLFNVLPGKMSIVGPRPEVKKYVDLYTVEQRKVLNIRPGITDNASIYYYNENKILEQQVNPEEYYIKNIMPDKISLNQEYLLNPTVTNYFRIILLTVKTVIRMKTTSLL
jgi:lipopolysaccharide/colanic/teichoic acid biosynthesis glycosyltransferase